MPVARFYGGVVFFPADAAAAVLHAWREWAPTLGDDLGVPVVDGVASGVATVRALVDLGLSTSRRLEFARPPAKAYAGSLARFAL